MKKMVCAPVLAAVILSFVVSVNAEGEKPAKYTVGSGKAGKTATKKADAKKSSDDTLVIAARLIEIPGTFPPNDLYNYVYVMKYRVLKVEKGSYKGKKILIGQYNPLIPRKKIGDKMDKYVDGNVEKFEEGAKHRLVLITPIDKVWKEAMEDEYFDSQMTKYYALKTDVLK